MPRETLLSFEAYVASLSVSAAPAPKAPPADMRETVKPQRAR